MDFQKRVVQHKVVSLFEVWQMMDDVQNCLHLLFISEMDDGG